MRDRLKLNNLRMTIARARGRAAATCCCRRLASMASQRRRRLRYIIPRSGLSAIAITLVGGCILRRLVSCRRAKMLTYHVKLRVPLRAFSFAILISAIARAG